MAGDDVPDLVAWDVALRVARQAVRLSPAPPAPVGGVAALRDGFAEATARAERLVEQATGLTSTAGRAHALVTDRAGWIEANIGSFRRLLRPVAARLAASPKARRALNPVSRSAAGAEVGLLLAWMSGRVLGQYDLLPAEVSDGGAVYYVGPNIAELERRHGFPPEQFRLWIALHELTHRLQFTGVPWMQSYFLGIIERGASVVSPDAQVVLDSLRRAVAEIRAGRNPLAEGGVVGLLASSDQLATLREAQALMSLLEGHGDVVMSSAARGEVPEAQRFAQVLHERRTSARGFSRFFQQAVGLEGKLRQYAEGEQFVESVIAAGGDALFSRVWESPEMLPSMEEIREPGRWVTRAGGRAITPA
ncbi:MAG: Coenzyme biosynthesis-associated protein [Acidimicrobiaceae bacterium]|nr:Coenzyme biosynthesis-associated protein [Acidimicrobiaceae bacterium]